MTPIHENPLQPEDGMRTRWTTKNGVEREFDHDRERKKDSAKTPVIDRSVRYFELFLTGEVPFVFFLSMSAIASSKVNSKNEIVLGIDANIPLYFT